MMVKSEVLSLNAVLQITEYSNEVDIQQYWLDVLLENKK